MYFLVFAALTGCAPQPASLEFKEGKELKVNELKEVALPTVKVLDKNKKEITPAPAVTWTVEPAAIAKLSADGKKITPVADGDVMVKAKVGNVEATYKLVVSLPDKVQIEGLAEGKVLAIGEGVQLTAKVLADNAEVPGLAVQWASKDDKVATVAAGMVTGVAKGETAVTATFDKLATELKVVVGDQPAPAAAPAKGPETTTVVKPGTATPAPAPKAIKAPVTPKAKK